MLGTALVPSATLATRARANNTQARADEPNAIPVAAGCGSVDLTATDWPIAQIAASWAAAFPKQGAQPGGRKNPEPAPAQAPQTF